MALAAGALGEIGAARSIVMIQPLRRAHFRVWLVLAVLLYAVFLAGLRARRATMPANAALHWEQYR